jgi:hypothetical protein
MPAVLDIGFTELATGGPNPLLEYVATTSILSQNTSNQPDTRRYSIVFVHGLQGHPKKTWTWSTANSSKIVYWPQDFLPQSTPDARILVYGYDSKVSRFFEGAANQNSFLGHARTLIHDLVAVRRQSVCPLHNCEISQR